MKRSKIIALTSIITFSLNIFTPNIFAQEVITNANIINSENSVNTTDSQNKTNQENVENTKPENEIKDDKNDKGSTSLNNTEKDNTKDKIENNSVENETKDNSNNKKEDTKKNNYIENNNVSSNSNDEIKTDSDKLQVKNTNTKVDEVVEIPDPNFKACLNRSIHDTFSNTYDNDDITLGQLESLTEIYNRNTGEIKSIEGIQYCKNLTQIDLTSNKISDISPLSGLTNLTELYMDNNQISDISPLSGLTNLAYLNMSLNNIGDISPLSGLTKLTALRISSNHISDISPLSGLTNLDTLGIHSNNISDISPLSGLTNLTELYIHHNNISDISALHGLSKLYTLEINDQHVNGSTVKSVGPNAVVNNIVRGLDGSFVSIQDGNGYTYDANNHQVKFTGITQTGDESYSFNQQVQIGQATGTFSGTVIQNIVYDQIIDIPDPNFKLCLNRNIHGTLYVNNDDITLSQLEGLTSIVRYNVHNIENIKGIEYCKNLTNLSLQNENISDISLLSGLTKLNGIQLHGNKISDISPLSNLPNLARLQINNNQISDISPLSGLTNLTKVYIDYNNIVDLSPLNDFKSNNVNISMTNQRSTLKQVVVDDGSGEIANPVTFPKFYQENPSLSISPSGNISYIKDGNKLNLNNLSDSDNEFTINESATINNGKINGNYSVTATLPVEHVSTIKVDLPTSMTFDVVTNTIDPATNCLKPTFATADYTIRNKGKKPISITPSYSVTSQGGVDLVESIGPSDIAKNNDVKVSVKLKNLSTNEDIMSVVNKETGTPFSVEADSNIQLRFEPGENGMADAAKEQLSDTKTTSGKMTFTISN